MIQLKSRNDIDKLAQGGEILRGILDDLEKKTVVGAVPKDLDMYAREKIAEFECVPAFLDYAPAGHEPFPAALCVSVNETVVHGLPGDQALRSGDVVGLDLGLIFENKYYLDSARTVIVGEASEEKQRLLDVTRDALKIGIEKAQVGNRIGDISAAVQEVIEEAGFGVVRQLVGHGVGFAVHEEPAVPNFGKAGEGEVIEEGLVICIEPMVTLGDYEVETDVDGWGIVSSDKSLTAHFEHTVAITKNGPRILT